MTLYAIGDIQGCHDAFSRLLDEIAFEPARDQLWLVGDLVNRGPDSLAVLRRVIELGPSVTTVLGNHDLHLLAIAAGIRPARRSDTIQSILDAPDAAELLDWLRHQPLLHYDATQDCVLVHAGIPPTWTLDEARVQAAAVETLLAGPEWPHVIESMYGDEPAAWMPGLDATSQLRYTINALTRMRYCRTDGTLDLIDNGPPGTQASGLIPWFDVANRKSQSTRIIFGHWAALGLYRDKNVIGLDSGCVWGGQLTALALDGSYSPVSVSCAACA